MKVEYNSIMEISLAVLSILTLSFAIAYYRAQKQISVIKQALAALIVNDNAVSVADIDTDRENFIKFLSDSREWAFEYIENVQSGLKKFIEEVQPQIDYYNKYGSVIEGMVPPHDFALKKISKEIEDLKSLLPEELNDRR